MRRVDSVNPRELRQLRRLAYLEVLMMCARRPSSVGREENAEIPVPADVEGLFSVATADTGVVERCRLSQVDSLPPSGAVVFDSPAIRRHAIAKFRRQLPHSSYACMPPDRRETFMPRATSTACGAEPSWARYYRWPSATRSRPIAAIYKAALMRRRVLPRDRIELALDRRAVRDAQRRARLRRARCSAHLLTRMGRLRLEVRDRPFIERPKARPSMTTR